MIGLEVKTMNVLVVDDDKEIVDSISIFLSEICLRQSLYLKSLVKEFFSKQLHIFGFFGTLTYEGLF